MLTILKPWLHEEWQYYREGSQWLVQFQFAWATEVKERCEKIGFTIKERCDIGDYFVCEVVEKTRIFDIRKLKFASGVREVSPNWMIYVVNLGCRQTIQEQQAIASRSKIGFDHHNMSAM